MVADWFDKPRPPSITTNATPRIPPCVGHATQDPDERPGDYLEYNDRDSGETVKVALHPAFDSYRAARSRYPAPLRADLVTLWKRDRQTVLSITADGKVRDFHLAPARLVVLLREIAEQLAENTVLQ